MSGWKERKTPGQALMLSRKSTGKSTDKEEGRAELLRQLDLTPDNYSDLHFDAEEMQKIRQKMTQLSTGATAALPLICKGASCPFSHTCPFMQIGKVPVDRSCPVEATLLSEWRRKYIIEYDLDADSMTDLTMLNTLAECELLEWRINNQLNKAQYAELIQDETVGIDREGNIHTKKTISALMNAKEQIQNRKAKVIKLLVGDRQEKYKREAALKIKTSQDPSMASASTRRELQKLIAQAKVANKELRQAAAIPETTTTDSPDPPAPAAHPADPADTLSPEALIDSLEPDDILEE